MANLDTSDFNDLLLISVPVTFHYIQVRQTFLVQPGEGSGFHLVSFQTNTKQTFIQTQRSKEAKDKHKSAGVGLLINNKLSR